MRGAALCVAAVFAGALLAVNDFTSAQTEFEVSGQVTNSFCGYGIAGVEVEIATYVEKSIAVTKRMSTASLRLQTCRMKALTKSGS